MISFLITVVGFNSVPTESETPIVKTESCRYRCDFENSVDAVIDAINKFPQVHYISVKAIES